MSSTAETALEPVERLLRRSGLVWLVLFGFWTLPGLLFASQLYFVYAMEQREISWWQLAAWQIPTWYYWALVTPLILAFGRRFPVARARWGRSALAHLGLATVVALLHAVHGLIFTKFIAPPPYSEFPLGPLFGIFLLQRFHLALLIYGGILGIGYGYDNYRKYRERELQASRLEARLAQAQLQALKMQLHPHFLFNTLNAVSVLVRKRAHDQAVNMLAGLSDLLRMALDNEGTEEVTLRQELEFLERYLALQQIRFQDRLDVQFQVAPETLDACLPNLILQPLVENAIRHGVGSSADAGLIRITAERDGEQLRVEVQDDGPGLGGDGQTKPGEGVGLSNTRKRLLGMYGENQRFELADSPSGGVVALVRVPFRLAPQMAEP